MTGQDWVWTVGAIVLAGGPVGFAAAVWERGWIPGTQRWVLRRSVRRVRIMLDDAPAAGLPYPMQNCPRHRWPTN